MQVPAIQKVKGVNGQHWVKLSACGFGTTLRHDGVMVTRSGRTYARDAPTYYCRSLQSPDAQDRARSDIRTFNEITETVPGPSGPADHLKLTQRVIVCRAGTQRNAR
jgi:hypothetical protein